MRSPTRISVFLPTWWSTPHVLAAKDALEKPPFELAVEVVLQNLRDKLRGAEGAESQSLLARAIEAIEAACPPATPRTKQ